MRNSPDRLHHFGLLPVVLQDERLGFLLALTGVFLHRVTEHNLVPVLRDGVLTRASQAAISTPESGCEMVYKGIIHKAVPVHPRKGYAYIFRGRNFIPVFIMDDINHLAEYVRFIRRMELIRRRKNENQSYNCLYNVFGYNPEIDNMWFLCSGSIFESAEETSLIQKELLEKSSLFEVYMHNIFIRFYSNYSFSEDIAVFIGTEGPLYKDYNSRIDYISVGHIEMVSPRFFIENNKVYCKEIPSIVSTYKDENDDTVFRLGNRVNVLRQKSRGHAKKRYNHWVVETGEIEGEYTNIKSANRYPIKLVCGETKAFRRMNGKYRGCSIHSIESNGMHLINELGGVMNIKLFP